MFFSPLMLMPAVDTPGLGSKCANTLGNKPFAVAKSAGLGPPPSLAIAPVMDRLMAVLADVAATGNLLRVSLDIPATDLPGLGAHDIIFLADAQGGGVLGMGISTARFSNPIQKCSI